MSLPAAQVRDPETYAIIGACMEVHREYGCGFLEAVYHDGLEIEFGLRNVPAIREVDLTLRYKGHPIRSKYRADFVCFGSIVVELKAIKKLSDIERAQEINYLKATGYTRALLINFGCERLEYERIVLGHCNAH